MKTLKSIGTVLVVAVFIWVVGAANLLAVATWVCRGKVTEEGTGNLIEGAVITFTDRTLNRTFTIKTNKKGEYLIRLPLARYRTTVKLKGYIPREDPNVAYPQNEDERIYDWVLTPGEGVLQSELTKEEQEKLKQSAEDIKKQQEEYEKYKKMSGMMKQLFDEAIEAKKTAQYDVAIGKLNEALSLDPKQPNILGHLAESYFLKGDFDLATENYNKALEIAPLDANLHTNLGNVYVKKNMMPEALAEFEKAVQLDPTHADINNYNVGVIMMNAQKYEEALNSFQKSIEANPNYHQAYYHLAMCQINKGNYAEAVASMDAYLKLAPTGEYAATINGMLPELRKLVGK